MDEEQENSLENSNDSTASPDSDSKNAISADLIRGHINTIILRTLYERDKYGYEIIEEIEKKSHGQYSLKQPTLYSALKRLESQGYINAYWKTDEVSMGGRRKYYTLTDSGKEITEKNQAEWEYSRTVIDSLISDKNFDFSQPAPTAVDFKILKSSTSRVPVIKDDDDEDNEDKSETVKMREVTFDAPPQTIHVGETAEAPIAQQTEEPKPMFERPAQMTEEERRAVHENYIKLISRPVEKPQEVPTVPFSENIDTEKLIYNNKPDTERDYRNLINNLFNKTIRVQQNNEGKEGASNASAIRVEDINAKANNDGLNVSASEFVVGSRRKKYSRGATLFKSSLIVSIIMLLEFALVLIFKKDLELTSYAYPFVILALACAQLMIFGVLNFTDIGKSSKKPATTAYLSASVIITIIIVFIICAISLLFNPFASIGRVMAYIVIPCIVALNIPIFALFFYLFNKQI